MRTTVWLFTLRASPPSLLRVIAQCLGVPGHNVRVHTRRVGGGLGGKSIKAMPISTACALAAYKLQRPVRMYVGRKTDMIIAGGRHPMKITYSVGFKSDGKITALHLDVLVNAGIGANISPILPNKMIGVLKKYNWGALSFDFKICKTNHSSKSAMLAPGEVQASYIAEAIIENVASWLSEEVDTIRNRNFHSYESLKLFYGVASGEPNEYTLPSLWDKVTSLATIQLVYARTVLNSVLLKIRMKQNIQVPQKASSIVAGSSSSAPVAVRGEMHAEALPLPSQGSVLRDMLGHEITMEKGDVAIPLESFFREMLRTPNTPAVPLFREMLRTPDRPAVSSDVDDTAEASTSASTSTSGGRGHRRRHGGGRG
ncbi:hypothetical protein SASPL_125214 [Salvia splendens]|uniref:Aldehyde oxidase/xanthine dehydrogenase first molybdopterin binding domain-containing protein n=1 Tax=Salvia splendens TaxID=180675 RepID=A0A8X8XGQ1_SALSN|nr:hypothetical protein SASPL_125214 [Salvia splendens]